MKKFIGAVAAAVVAVLAIQYMRVVPSRQLEEMHPRIVSLAPSLTEIVFELGAGDHLVGVTNYCTYPPEARKKEKVGDFINPDLEKIISLKPDLVLAERWTSSKIVPRLRQMKLNVVETASPKSLAEIYAVIRDVGTTVGRPDRAADLVANMQERIHTIEERGKRFPRRPTVYIEIDLPSWTVGRNSFIHEAVSLCGARNVFEDVERPALQVSKEMVVKRNPEIILSFEASASEIRQRPGWDQIQAVRHGDIIKIVNRNLLSHGNHRLVEGMEELQVELEKTMGQRRTGAEEHPQTIPDSGSRSPG